MARIMLKVKKNITRIFFFQCLIAVTLIISLSLSYLNSEPYYGLKKIHFEETISKTKMMSPDSKTIHKKEDHKIERLSLNNRTIPFVIVLCTNDFIRDQNSNNESSLENDIYFQQVIVLLKSMAITTKNKLRVIILSNKQITLHLISNYINRWQKLGRMKLQLKYQTFNLSSECMNEKYFKPCTSVRLFLHEILPYEDKVVYVDSDIIFLQSPDKIFIHFDDFDGEQFLGAAPDIFNSHPLPDYYQYGTLMMQCGLLLMKLSKIRNLPYNWSNAVVGVCKSYRRRLILYDQGVLNIIFSEYPHNVYDIDCRWNFHLGFCKNPTICSESIVSPGGISAVQGNNNNSFFRPNTKFKVIFDAFQKVELNDSLSDLTHRLRSGLNDELVINNKKDACQNFTSLNDAILFYLK